MELGYIKPNRTAPWQATPHLVPKEEVKFRFTIDLRPVKASKVGEARPMPNIEAELANFAGCTCFATMEFCRAYW